ncbi:hypothetical protein [Paraburkholderia sp. HD33-4]|uniref:hypothetical protein n=1 Tax=Paraburkholderia sp. HD33-4 TaxID=2883242 RepID=UPI001F1581D0|nr:hypothetical protein [Paraburkholderia sp. HD33-4]
MEQFLGPDASTLVLLQNLPAKASLNVVRSTLGMPLHQKRKAYALQFGRLRG